MNAALVTVCYLGKRRALSLKLNNVPAEVCPHCELPMLTPEVRDQVNDMCQTMSDTAGPLRWQLERAA
jgi:hypothetical protein